MQDGCEERVGYTVQVTETHDDEAKKLPEQLQGNDELVSSSMRQFSSGLVLARAEKVSLSDISNPMVHNSSDITDTAFN